MTSKADKGPISIESINQQLTLGFELTSTQVKSAYHIACESEAESKELNYPDGIARSLVLKGVCQSLEGLYSPSIENTTQAIRMGTDSSNSKILCAALHSLGNTYSKLGDLEKALVSYLEGLQHSRLFDSKYTVILLNNIAVVYSKMNQLDQSLIFLEEALTSLDSNTSSTYGFLLANIAEVHFKLGNMNEALDFAQRSKDSLDLMEKNNLHMIQCLKVLGKIYGRQGNYEMALANFDHAKRLCLELGDQYRNCTILSDIGRLYMEKHDYSKALEVLNDAYDLASTISAEVEQRDLSQLLSACYEMSGNYPKALEYLKRNHALAEKINTHTLDNRLFNQSVAFEIEQARKDAEIEKLRHEETRRLAEQEVLRSAMLADSLRDIHVIGEIGQLITASLNMKTVLNLVYKHIRQIIELNVVGICLYDPKNETVDYKLMIKNGKPKPMDQVSINDPTSLAAKCIREKATIIELDIKDAPMRSAIFIPLLSQSQAIGAMTIQSIEPSAFSNRTTQMVVALGAYIAIALKNSMQSEALEKKTKEMEKLSQTDTLTKLYNRRYMLERLNVEIESSNCQNSSFAIAVIDVDHFKAINDANGHIGGDVILSHLSRHLKKSIRPTDVICRWGGEEFLLLMPDTKPDDALTLSQRLCSSVARKEFYFNRKRVPVTITIGLAASAYAKDCASMIHKADTALYLGKEQGRNRVVFME